MAAIPDDLCDLRERVLTALKPVAPVGPTTKARKNFLLTAQRTEAGRQLPPYYLVYFLLIDFLGFKNLGQFEKLAWSVPVDYKGKAFLIEHRKMGLGVFAQDLPEDEGPAAEITERISRAVRMSQPFFDWLANQAVAESKINVVNRTSELFERFEYLRDLALERHAEAAKRQDDVVVTEGRTEAGHVWKSYLRPGIQLEKEASWLALSAVEAFFAWTEHAFIHLAVLQSNVSTAEEVADLAAADWSTKFKTALDVRDSITKDFYDRLVAARRDLRNYVAHGAFGKQGEAFKFHSGAGAVPVMLPHRQGSRKFRLGYGLRFDAEDVLTLIGQFNDHLWSGKREAAKTYLHESDLPVILDMARDGTYEHAMQSAKDMSMFVNQLSERFDRAANMDW